jgi:hypothetical protein
VSRDNESARYNGLPTPVTELQRGVQVLPINVAWWRGLEALPFSTSDAVVLGRISNAQAFLSADKTGAFSAFTMAVEKTLKGKLAASEITAERVGGTVRFPSGQLQSDTISGQGWPQVGERYLLFLKGDGSTNYTLITGYHLHGGKVRALDGANARGGRLPFNEFDGISESSFFRSAQSALRGNRK